MIAHPWALLSRTFGSIHGSHWNHAPPVFIPVFIPVCIAQVILCGRLKAGLRTGRGPGQAFAGFKPTAGRLECNEIRMELST